MVIQCVCLCKEGREATPDLATSPRRQAQGQGTNGGSARPKEPPPMVVQGDFRKVCIVLAILIQMYKYKIVFNVESRSNLQ